MLFGEQTVYVAMKFLPDEMIAAAPQRLSRFAVKQSGDRRKI
jgi:hypothetical protein